MNKKLSIAMGIALASMSGLASADAASDMGLEFSANVALTTDYVFRGVSQTGREAAIQGGFDVAHTSGVYAGTWASNVDEDFYPGSSMEIDFYVGWAGDVGPIGVDVGFNHFEYPGVDNSDNNTDEWKISGSYDFEVASVGAAYYYSDDWYGTGNSSYWDFSGEVPVGSFTIAAHYGITDFDDGGDYDDWKIGVSTELGGFGFDLSYTDTDADDGFFVSSGEELADDTFIFTISKAL